MANRLNVQNIYASDSDTTAALTISSTDGISAPGLVGMIAAFAMSTAPTGWLACDGSTNVSKTTYADLYNALTANDTIPNPWGSGDDSSTFALPDLEGAFLRGIGSHGTSTMANGSAFSGPTNVGDFENDSFQGHAHQVPLSGGSAGGGNINVQGATFNVSTSEANQTTTHGTPRTGDETRPFNAGVLYCIKF